MSLLTKKTTAAAVICLLFFAQIAYTASPTMLSASDTGPNGEKRFATFEASYSTSLGATAWRFQYGPAAGFPIGSTQINATDFDGNNFSVIASGLNIQTDYECTAQVFVDGGWEVSNNSIIFTTLPEPGLIGIAGLFFLFFRRK
ncbi:hypothetical protein KAH27_00730 [bacterium]|nr:hypothetical protein [bacterium]